MKILILIGLMTVVLPAQADAYRCKDAAGRTLYQEKPCETTNLTPVGKVAKPVGSFSREAMEKSQEEIKAYNQRYLERKKVEQEASQKEEKQNKGQAEERKAGEP